MFFWSGVAMVGFVAAVSGASWGWVVLGVAAAFLVLGAFNQLHARKWRHLEPVFDEVGVRRQLKAGEHQAVTWRDLRRVRVVTTGAGPWREDVFLCSRTRVRPWS